MTLRANRGALATAFGAICAAGAIGTPAEATNGYFANGYDAASKAMAGSAVAVDTGPIGAAVNPALGFDIGNSAGGCVSIFSPHTRGFTVGGAALIAPGTYESENDVFYVPCLGANFQLSDRITLGFTAVGNGGMNTEYSTNPFPGGSTAPLGVNLEQLIMSANLAYKVNENVTLGFAPVYAFQKFSATGLEGFAGYSSDRANLTNNGNDYSRGWGFNVGILVDVTPNLTFGAAYRSKIDMSEFSQYAGLFAEGGDFDIPATATVGGAYTLPTEPRLTLTAEWQRIFYGDVAAIANPENLFGSAQLGAANGSGFGWDDMDVFRVGAIWQHSDQLTLRGGVSYATEFTDSSQVLFNTLAPATPQWHVSIGADYRLNENWTVTGSYVHAFDNSLSGTAPVGLGTQPISVFMEQDEVTVGMNYTW